MLKVNFIATIRKLLWWNLEEIQWCESIKSSIATESKRAFGIKYNTTEKTLD